jgi:hypothetical protein
MSKALRTVAVIAGAVALVATGVGAVAGGTIISKTAAAAAVGTAKAATAGTLGALTGTIATAAGLAAGAAALGAQLTAPKPIARGSPAQVIIDVEPPRPYIVGRVMTGGVMRHDVAYGPTIKRVPNPYRWQVRVLSGVGPIQGIAGQFFDFQTIGGFYTGFYATTQNLGDRPQATALVPPFGAAPGWTSASRLSGCAHVGLNFLFDRDGERFASGIPIYTALCDGEKVYDPRQDSTFPGGSGPCRPGVESTYVYNANPACHAATYALGRFQNGKRLFGMGQSVDTIDWPAIVDWANDCDANEWEANILLFEGGTGADLREQRVRNLDDLCAAGGGRWYQAGGLLSFDWNRPRVALATLTDEDILEAGGGTDAVQTVRDRMNGVRPQYVSPDHNWQQITAAEIVGTAYRTEDGTPLTQVYPLNGVTNAAQAGELASYAMADSRELGPMDLQAKAKWRFYRPGDCIEIDSSLVAYSGQAIINQRGLNPEIFAVSLSLKSETPGKHDFALGKVADPPPTPVLAQTSEERDLQAAAALRPREIDAEEGSTKGATLLDAAEYDPTTGVVGNIFDSAGNPRKPGEVLNTEIQLTPDGRLQYFELPNLPAIELGAITLPDLGAASDEALRRAQDDTEALARAISTALDNVSATRETFRDAGFYVDEATGQVRIFAIDQTEDRISSTEIRLDAAESNINLRATTNYVDQAIADAVLDPSQIADLDTVFVRLTAAELDIDGLEATVTTLATVTELSLVEGRVTTAENEINALEGTVTTKVDTTTFNALETRVTSAESTLTSLGDTATLVNSVTAIRVIEKGEDANAENNLRVLLQEDRNQRDQVTAIADARQELTARIIDGDSAEATARLALQARVTNAEASVAQESIARASGDTALASQITALTATVGSNTAAIQNESTARVSGDNALSQQISSLTSTVNGNTAAIQNESQARANGDTALAGQINTLSTTVNGNTATLTTFGESIDGLEARQGVRLDVNGRITGYVQNNDGSQGDFNIVADNFRVIDPDTGAAFIDADENGLRLRNGRVIMDNGIFIRATGVGFGTSGQFIEWFGPRPTGGNLALCNEANAISYLKTNGDAFFGGTLSAGVLRNAARTTSILADATVTVGPFGTNGNPIVVITSYALESGFTDTYEATNQALQQWDADVIAWGAVAQGGGGFRTVDASKSITCNVVAQLQRALGGTAPSAFATLTITGGIETLTGIAPTPGDAPGNLVYTRTVSGSITSTDNTGGVQNRTFIATLTARTDAVIGTIQTQTLGITATEE